MRRVVTLVLTGALIATVAGAAYWAGTTALAPPALPVEEHSLQVYEVAPGTVGRTVQVPVTATWSTERILFADSDGVATSIEHPAGDPAQPGDVLLTVDLEPLVVAIGAVPMFRTLESGLQGPDVAQLQVLLMALGFLEGPADGRFDQATLTATTEWQESVGAVQDGVVEPGSLVFLGDLPMRMVVVSEVGQRVGVGDELVRVLAESPGFVATVGASQRAELTSGITVAIGAPGGGTWQGQLGSSEQLEDGRYAIEITGPLCSQECAVVPIGGELVLSGTIELVPETSGVVVPVSALFQQPSGAVAVTLADGAQRAVTVVAEADGFAVVEGVEAGTLIQLPSPPRP